MTNTSGIKAIPIDQFPDEAWRLVLGESISQGTDLSVLGAYEKVGLMYRAVDIRAKAVSAFPYTLERRGVDVTDSPQTEAIRKNLRRTLHLTEASLSLWGASYALALSSRLQWLQTQTITPDYDPKAEEGIKGWKRAIPGAETKPLARDAIVYVWLPNLKAESGPGAAPAVAALAGAGVLYGLDLYLKGYFDRGAIRATLLIVEGQPSKEEKEKLEKWWKKMIGGVKKAYETVALRSNVKPIVIGDGLKETTNKALTDQERENVLIPMGVPISKVLSNAANYATAQQDDLSFYDNTIIPEIELIGEQFAPWFKSMGYTLIFRPERLAPFRERRLKQAESLSKLAGPAPLMSRDEAREELGLKPWLEVNPDDTPEPPTMPGAPSGTGPGNPAQPEPATPASPGAAATEVVQSNQQAGGRAAPAAAQEASKGITDRDMERAKEISRWNRKAATRIEQGRSPLAFKADHLSPLDQSAIRGALAMCRSSHDVDRLFASLKRAPGVDLSPDERRLYDALLSALEPFSAALAGAIVGNQAIDLGMLDSALRAALVEQLTQTVIDTLGSLPGDLGSIAMAGADMSAGAIAWADSYVQPLVGSLVEHTRSVVERAINAYRTTPGLTRADVESMLVEAFGARRAELIAITETTRAAAQATSLYRNYLTQNGIATIRIWQTNQDELVCPICGALDGTPDSDWSEVYPDGPPAHVRCRCNDRLELE